MSWQTFGLGFLGLALLEVIVTSSQATNRVGGLATETAKAISWFLDSNTPAFSTKA